MILLCSLVDGLGGAEQFLLKLGKYYKRRGMTVNICFLGKKTNIMWEKEGFNISYFNSNLLNFILYIKEQKKIQIVFSTHLMMNAFLGLLRSFFILKTEFLICRESTSVFLRYKYIKLLKYKFAYWFGYRNINLLITQSEMMRNTLINHLGYLERRVEIKTIPNLFEFPKEIVYPYDKQQPYIVSAGRLIPEKGFDILILSFKELIKYYPKINLIILGEGDERKTLEELIHIHGLTNKVFLKGFVENVYPYFKGAEMCVVSSRIEGFPNVLLQMMSQNSKVVSTLCAGGIDDIKGMITCNIESEEDLIEGMLNCMNLSDVIIKDNRLSFDLELKKRSIENFISQLNI